MRLRQLRLVILPLFVAACDTAPDIGYCPDPFPVVVLGEETGMLSCSNGVTHRPTAFPCAMAASDGGCGSDDDCRDGSACRCTDDGGVCMDSDCRTDSECVVGFCADTSVTKDGEGRYRMGYGYLRCQRADDECVSHEDCGVYGYCDTRNGRAVCTDTDEARDSGRLWG